MKIRKPLGEIGRGESDVHSGVRVRPGIDQKLAGGSVSVARRDMQGAVPVRVRRFHVRAVRDQHPQKVGIAVPGRVVERRPPIGVPRIDACAGVQKQACDVRVPVANGDLQRSAAVAIEGIRVDAGIEEHPDRREVVQPYRPEEIVRGGRLRSRAERSREHHDTGDRGVRAREAPRFAGLSRAPPATQGFT